MMTAPLSERVRFSRVYGCRKWNPWQGSDIDAGEGGIRGLDEAGDEEWFVGRLKDGLCGKRVCGHEAEEEEWRQSQSEKHYGLLALLGQRLSLER